MPGIPEKTVLVFGSGRSGTTWVQDVLAIANSYRTIFEPLHPDVVKGASPFANLYAKPGSTPPGLQNFFDRLIEGKLHSIWAQYRVRPDRLFPPPAELVTKRGVVRSISNMKRLFSGYVKNRGMSGRPAVIKFIRANLLMEWILAEYRLSALLVLRHPCAVLSSVTRRQGAEWESASIRRLFENYLGQEQLVNEHLGDTAGALNDLQSFAEVQTAVWCIENAWLIKNAKNVPAQLVHYEHLLLAKEGYWTRLVKEIGLHSAPDADVLEKPSQQAAHRMLNRSFGEDQIQKWLPYVSDEQKNDVQRVLDIFGVRVYNAFETMPTYDLSG